MTIKLFIQDSIYGNSRALAIPDMKQMRCLNHYVRILIFVKATSKQLGKAKDLASKREIPKGDALQGLIARDHHAILVSIRPSF
jgi:hypothetical protein